jgi:hypothetical protein
MIRELAHLAILDGACHSELYALSKAGNFGQIEGNVHRDLMVEFAPDVRLDHHELSVMCIDPKSSAMEETKAAMFLPHVMFSNLAKGYPTQFESLLQTAGLEDFWSGAQKTNDDRLWNHPMTLESDWKRKTIPIFIHGDGVEFQERDSLMVWSWGSLLSLFSSLDNHLLISVFPKSCTCTETWQPIMKWLVWSLKAMLQGVHPEQDPDGMPFAEDSCFALEKGQPLTPFGLRCVVWSIQGDHDFFANVLGLPHWSKMHPCWECDCHNNVAGPPNTLTIEIGRAHV